MITITKERFEAWLFSQPRDRSFVYTNCRGCLIATFLNEMTNQAWACGDNYYRNRKTHEVTLYPEWLATLDLKLRLIHGEIKISDVQEIFTSQNPNVESSISSPSEKQTDSLADSSVTPTQEGCLNVSCKTNK